MKLKNITKYISGSILLALLLPVMTSCEQEYRFSSPLAMYQKEILLPILAPKNGTNVVVYADGDWKITPLDDESWLTFSRRSGSDPGSFNVTYPDNEGHARMCRILVTANSKKDTVVLKQKGLTPVFNISDPSLTILSNELHPWTRIDNNIPTDWVAMSVQYLADIEGNIPEEKWISNVSIENKILSFDATENTTGAKRGARICFKFINVLNQLAADTINVYQNKPLEGVDDYKALTFDQVRALKLGALRLKNYVEGIVISDKNNKNLAPLSEISTTVYLKNPNANETFIIKTGTTGDNNFNFGDLVRISLNRVILSKDATYNLMTISGVGINNILYKDNVKHDVQPKEVYLKDLTDKDLYTYIKLKDVEFAVPTGSYFNINTAYGQPAYTPIYPKLMRDANGDAMYLLTNVDGVDPYINGVSYQKSPTPQGSGSIAGILCKETIKGYGKNHGRYYLRHLWEKDIALTPERENGFSQVIAEWSKHGVPEGGKNTLTSETGIGELSHSSCKFKNIRLNGTANTEVNLTDIGYNLDYNGLDMAGGHVMQGDFRCANWWPDNATEGAWWLVQLPTIGITKQMSIQIEGNSYSAKDPVGFPSGQYSGPCNFTVQYSLDMGTTWKTVGDYTMEAQGIWYVFSDGLVPGFKAVNFNLPMECCGQAELQIRLKMKNKEVGYGTFLNSLYNDLGHLSIKCNK